MLIAFALTNRACFRERQELSMEAVRNTGDAFAFDTGVRQAPRLNRVAAIYGPNGTGKSRLIDGLAFARHLVLNSSKESQAGEKIPYEPFLLAAESRERPTTFEIAFIEAGTMYEYGFAVDSARVHKEWLLAWPPDEGPRRSRMRSLLERRFDPDSGEEEWRFGPSVRGSKSVWRDNTRPNALLVSTAVQLNSETFRPVVDWFQKLRVLPSGNLPPFFTGEAIKESEQTKARVLNLLQAADIAAADIDVDETTTPLEELKDQLPPQVFVELSKRSPTLDHLRLGLVHSPADGVAHSLDLDEESDGTQRYFSLAFPWLDVLENDWVLVVDELDRSLHPLLVASLVQQFNRAPDGGACRAQLVATVHDAYLLEETLDRGQVWLTGKDRNTEAASLTALSDYSPRKDEALMRGYLGGRYGGVPVVVAPEALG